MMKIIRIWSTLLFILVGMTGCIKDDVEEPKGANIQAGDALPDFSVCLNNGEQVNTQALKGKVSVIILFTVVCTDCQKQLPVVEQIFQQYKGVDDVLVFGISRAEGESAIKKFWEKNNYTFPYSAQDTREVYSLFAASIVPRIYISGRSGIVDKVFMDDPIAGFEELKEAIDRLMNQ